MGFAEGMHVQTLDRAQVSGSGQSIRASAMIAMSHFANFLAPVNRNQYFGNPSPDANFRKGKFSM